MKEKLTKFVEEFKAFALRGNALDMAVGVIIGGAFTSIVTSLTDNFINPILNFVTGGKMYSFEDIAGFASAFISSIVNFLIMAFVLFCILKAMNTLMDLGKKKMAAEAEAADHITDCFIGHMIAIFLTEFGERTMTQFAFFFYICNIRHNMPHYI